MMCLLQLFCQHTASLGAPDTLQVLLVLLAQACGDRDEVYEDLFYIDSIQYMKMNMSLLLINVQTMNRMCLLVYYVYEILS